MISIRLWSTNAYKSFYLRKMGGNSDSGDPKVVTLNQALLIDEIERSAIFPHA